MKIGPSFTPIPITPGLRTQRNDGDGGAARQQYHQNQNRREGQNPDGSPPDQDLPEKVTQAIEAFHADATTVASGLRASLEGAGPGLRIILKDVNGSVVRQFSGEEFLRLGRTSTGSGQLRGKILDRKL